MKYKENSRIFLFKASPCEKFGCQYNGSCFVYDDKAVCSCFEGFSGEMCESKNLYTYFKSTTYKYTVIKIHKCLEPYWTLAFVNCLIQKVKVQNYDILKSSNDQI